MSEAKSSALSLSSDYFLSNYYKYNRGVRKNSGRGELSTTELSYEDARALRRAVAQLGSFSYTENDNIENVRNAVTAFVDTYNNALASSGKDDSDNVSRYARQLKKLATKYKDELEDLGISVDTKKGTLSVNKNLLSVKKIDKIKEVFSRDDTDLLKSTGKIARSLVSNTHNELYTRLTGAGGTINITL